MLIFGAAAEEAAAAAEIGQREAVGLLRITDMAEAAEAAALMLMVS
jgi:hypothetical protein